MKRINWDIEEMVAMVDIYYRNENGLIENLSNELIKLSKRLNIRADVLNIEHDEKFRNLNGMNMILIM